MEGWPFCSISVKFNLLALIIIDSSTKPQFNSVNVKWQVFFLAIFANLLLIFFNVVSLCFFQAASHPRQRTDYSEGCSEDTTSSSDLWRMCLIQLRWSLKCPYHSLLKWWEHGIIHPSALLSIINYLFSIYILSIGWGESNYGN